MNKLILVVVAACALSAPVAAQTPAFTPVGPAVLAGQGYQYASNDIAYDDKQDVYLMVQGHTFAGGRFVNANGQLIGSQFDIARQSGSDAESRVAYTTGSADDVFLVTFRSELGGGTQIYGRLVTYSGGNPVLGPLLGMTELSSPRPGRQVNGGIAFDAIRRQFLVTWEDWRFGLPRVMGRLWALSGAASAPTLVPATADFTIGNDIAGSPNVAYDTAHNVYMVVYRGPHPSNGAISGSFGRMVAFSGGQPQVSAFIELTAGNGEPGEQNVIYLPETDNFLTIWTDITNVRDVSGRVVNHAGATVTPVFPLLNTPSNEGAADLGYSSTTHSILLAGMRDQTKRIQGVQLTAAGALTDSYFLASTALPGSGLESFFPNVAPAENGRFGLSYVNDYQYGWVEVLQGSGVTGPPPPPPPSACAVEPLPSATTVNLGGAAETRTITVTASTADCAWTATSSASWLTISAGASGAGPGTTTYAVTRNASGATRSATVTVGSGRVTVTQAPSLTNAALHDISGARASDIMWHNISTGQVAVWDVEGWTVTNAYYLWNPVDTNWRVAGTGDLDGDGFADIVWRHSTGTVAAWFLRNGGIVGAQVLSLDGAAAVESDATWEIRAVGDLDGDGRCDIIWQNMSVGTLGVWYMNGGTVRSRASFNMGMPDANWKIAGAGDLNLDGKADIIWQNHATGFLGAWAMDGHTVIWTGNLAPTSDTKIADTNWKIRGVGDTNGDGFADLVWQNMSTGDVGVWFLRYVTVLEKRPLTIPRVAEPSKWHIVGPG